VIPNFSRVPRKWLTEVAAILGHEDLNTTRRYTQPGYEDLHRAVGWIAGRE
jgi:hypothetical protein